VGDDKSLPQTTHLTAFSLTRVPQVGQILVEEVDFSGLIIVGFSPIEKIIPAFENQALCRAVHDKIKI